jgi:hypothetical protein
MNQEILGHLDKNNLHHAYLLSGAREEILPVIFSFIQNLGIKTSGNPDFCEINVDNFKIDEAFFLRSMAEEKGFTAGAGNKKIFIVSANIFSLDAQQALLKMFEEPKENTHFFLIVPDANALLPTLISRFYVIVANQQGETKEVEKFIAMSPGARINFLKDFLQAEEEDEEVAPTDSIRAKSLRFLNNLEVVLHHKLQKNFSGFILPGVPGGAHTIRNSFEICFLQIFQARKFLRQPGSSAKSLMESVALTIPMLQ